MNKKTIIIALLTFTFVTPVLAQNIIKKASRSICFSKKNFVDTIKIKVTDGAVIVPVEIEGKTRRFVLDTGAPLGVWQRQKESWMRPITADSLIVGDANMNMGSQTLYQFPAMKMGNLLIENYPMLVEDAMGDFLCDMFDGVLGFNLVGAGLSFKLDTKDSLLIVTDKKNFFIEEEKGKPVTKYTMKEPYRPEVIVETPLGLIESVFDTGAFNIWYELPQEYLDQWLLQYPENRKMLDNLTEQMDTVIKASAGLYGLTTDTLMGRLLHFPTMKIGELPLNDFYCTTVHRTMRLGSAILKHASLIIDAPRKQFVFLPHNKQDITVGNSQAGSIALIPAEAGDTRGLLKAVIRKGSTAYQKGIRTGDYLKEVNGIAINDICTYMHIEWKDVETQCKFCSPDGTEKVVWLIRTN